MNWRAIIALLLPSITFFVACPFGAAAMSPASDPELGSIQCHSGISIQLSWRESADYLRYENTDDGSYWELQDINLDDGAGGPIDRSAPLQIDIGANGGRTCLILSLPGADAGEDGIFLSADSMELNGRGAGSLAMGNLRNSPSKWYIGSHADGSTGMDMRLETAMQADDITYRIGDSQFALQGIYLSRDPGGNAENPSMGTGLAIIGSGSWAQGNLGTNSNGTFLQWNIPVQGALRIGNVNLAGQNYGPAVVDNLDGTIRVRAPGGAQWQY